MVASNPHVIRCSRLDDLFACAPSVLKTDTLRVNPSSDAAELGKAVHELAAELVEQGTFDTANVLTHYGLDEQRDTVLDLMGYIQKAWGELGQYFKQPRTEAVTQSDVIEANDEHWQIEGTCDVVSPLGTQSAIFLDWKTGFIEDGYQNQMAGYAYNLWCYLGRPQNTTITGVVVFARHRYYRVVKYDAARLEQWEYDLKHNVLARPDEYRPGNQCRYCDLYSTCEARKAVVEGTLDTMMFRNSTGQYGEYQQFLDDARDLLAGLTPENKHDPKVAEVLSTLQFRMRLAQQAVDDTRKLMRQAVERVGPIPLNDDTALAIRNVNVKEIDPLRGWRVLRQYLSDTQIAEGMKLSLRKLQTVYANQQHRGQKGLARQQLEQELEKQGAIIARQQHRMEEVDLSTAHAMEQDNAEGEADPETADGSAGGDQQVD